MEQDVLSSEHESSSGGRGTDWPATTKVRANLTKDDHETVRWFLNNGYPVPIPNQFLLEAKRLLVKGVYHLSVVTAVIALEAVIEDFISEGLESKGISGSKIEALFRQVTLKPQVDVMLKLLVQPHELDYSVLDNVSTAIKTRNEVVHEGRTSAAKAEAESAINNIEELVSFIISKTEKLSRYLPEQ